MKTIFTKKSIFGLALSAMSIVTMAQCPTLVAPTTVSNTSNGSLIVSQTYSPAPTGTVTNVYTLIGPSHYSQQTSMGSSGIAIFSNLPTGTYSLCVQDSIFSSPGVFCPVVSGCIQVSVTNTVVPSCNASFSYYTDSACVTHFTNTSPCSYSTTAWNVDGTVYNIGLNPLNLNLTAGSHNVTLSSYVFSGGSSVLDTVSQVINISCGTSTVTPPACNASFSYYTDSACVTHFTNTTPCSYSTTVWNVDGVTYNTGMNSFSLSLTAGSHNVVLSSYVVSGGVSVLDTLSQTISVSCGGGSTVIPVCNANAQISVFADSSNTGNYFAYNLSTGTGVLSYLWNFGDGTTSTQQYPFHQYATPGSYIICLTVTANNGTTTCSSTTCDSSSVQRIAAGFLMSQISVIPQAATSIQESSVLKSFNAFPNPLLDELTIDVQLTQPNTKLSFYIIDALGKVVTENSITDSKIIVNTSNLEKGFYFLTVNNEDGKVVKTIKLIK